MKRTTTLIAAITMSLIAAPSFADQVETPIVETQKLDQQATGSIQPCERTGLFSTSCEATPSLTGKKYPEAPAMPQFGI